MSLLLLFFGGSGSGVVPPSSSGAATPTVTADDDTHSWFEFSPYLLPVGVRAPVVARGIFVGPPGQATVAITIAAPPPERRMVPAGPSRFEIPVLPRLPEAPAAVFGIGRGILPGGYGRMSLDIGDPDEELLPIVALTVLQTPVRRRDLLVNPQAVEERWLSVVAALLAERG